MKKYYLFVLICILSCLYGDVYVTDVMAEGCSTRYFTACVTDEHGMHIHDLEFEDFEFALNGHSITLPQIEMLNNCPSESLMVDIVLFLDLSTSMDDEVFLLGTHLTDFVDGIAIMDYRIAIVIFNGCREEVIYPEEGVLELVRTDFSTIPGTCWYSPTATDIWATNLDEFQCLYDAGHNEFYVADPALRGSGDEDQYGAMAYFATHEISFRDGARRVFCLFTDERPIYSEDCRPSYGPSDDDLSRFIELMNLNRINVIPVTPVDGMFQYGSADPPERAFYDGYVTLGDSTDGAWVDLYATDYSELVRNITRVIACDSCCYDFRFTDTDFCSGTNTLAANVPGWGMGSSSYQAQCPPRALWHVPSPACYGWSSCPEQDIQIRFFNEAGLDFGISEIELEVNEELHHMDSYHITMPDDSTLIFEPGYPWENGETVRFEMYYALDDSGCPLFLEACSLRIDIAPPVYWGEYPPDDTLLFDFPESIYFLAFDSLSGINYDEFGAEWFDITVNSSPRPGWTVRIAGDTVFVENLEMHNGDTIRITATMYDSPDYDYCEPNASSFNYNFTVYSTNPIAERIYPQPDIISACPDQFVEIWIYDEDGIDWSTVEISVAGRIFDWDSGNLSNRGDTLVFNPPENFYYSGQTVEVRLLRADDLYGYELVSDVHWSFIMDFEPPLAELTNPREWEFLTDLVPTLYFDVWDSISGLDNFSVEIELLNTVIRNEQLYFSPIDSLGSIVELHMDIAGLRFTPGDTVPITLTACDRPDTCGPNCAEYEFTLIIEPIVFCSDSPDPFSPNSDDYNPYAVFTYPNLFSQDAELMVFNKRKELVYNTNMQKISNWSQFENRKWDGIDNNKRNMPPGLYLYIIKQDGKVICEGTITLVR